ncbi:hypothetical protein [Brachyspira sp. SAP_772]|uniref:hypothetical protein n=1 Tax=Brachyspira sp. SAP_772 TaxID=2608385 RepID=UPI0012F4A2EA|nr:hypothetical protein [Brachyspira sp. SAP_772]
MKKILITIVSIISFSTYLFPLSSFDLSLSVPIGGSFPSFQNNDKNLNNGINYRPEAAIEIGVLLKPKFNFEITNNHIISAGVELGYYRDTFQFDYDYNNITDTAGVKANNQIVHVFDSFNIGGTFEYQYLNFFCGVGVGFKIPLAGAYWYEETEKRLSLGLLYGAYRNAFIFIPYTKIFAGLDIGIINVSAYLNFDLPYVETRSELTIDSQTYSSASGKLSAVDLGVQISLNLDLFNDTKY